MKEKLQCDNCGGVLDHEGHDIFACKYCGMKYKITGWQREEIPIVKIVTNPSKYNVIGANLMVTDEVKHYMRGGVEEIVKRQLVNKISEYIYENFDNIVEWYSDYDICKMTTVYSAKMRVLKGDKQWK